MNNGEIYNYLEIKEKYLDNINFKSKGDTEVFLKIWEKFGIPKSVSDLSKHTIIAFGHDVEPSIPDVNCILDLIPKSKKPKTIYISNMYGVMRAIGGGAGIGALPEYMKISNNNLVPILPNANTPKTIIYFTYPPASTRH